MSRYVTIQDIADRTGFKAQGVRRAVKKMNVRHENLGGRAGIRITAADADRFIAKRWPQVFRKVGPMAQEVAQ